MPGSRPRAVAGLVLTAAALTGALVGCSGEPEFPRGPWELVAGEVDGVALEIDPATPATLAWEHTTASGSGGCNTWSAAVSGTLAEPRFSEVMMTEMACVDEAGTMLPVMTTEAAYTAGLSRVNAGALERGILTLTGPAVTLRFGRP